MKKKAHFNRRMTHMTNLFLTKILLEQLWEQILHSMHIIKMSHHGYRVHDILSYLWTVAEIPTQTQITNLFQIQLDD